MYPWGPPGCERLRARAPARNLRYSRDAELFDAGAGDMGWFSDRGEKKVPNSLPSRTRQSLVDTAWSPSGEIPKRKALIQRCPFLAIAFCVCPSRDIYSIWYLRQSTAQCLCRFAVGHRLRAPSVIYDAW